MEEINTLLKSVLIWDISLKINYLKFKPFNINKLLILI